jgi:hypothetical protein
MQVPAASTRTRHAVYPRPTAGVASILASRQCSRSKQVNPHHGENEQAWLHICSANISSKHCRANVRAL